MILLLLACGAPPEAPPTLPPVAALSQSAPLAHDPAGLYTIGALPQHAPTLADGEGRAELEQHCTSCHSLTYVTMQPPLPADKWAGIVTKMQAVFGAEIPEPAAASITSYLQAHYTPETIAGPVAAAPPGGAIYAAHCAACHQGGGAGVPGRYPALAGRMDELVAGSREYPLAVLVHGLRGEIEVDGTTYRGLMPAIHATDAELAAVLDFVVADLGTAPPGYVPYTAAEVAAERARERTPDEVRALRPVAANGGPPHP